MKSIWDKTFLFSKAFNDWAFSRNESASWAVSFHRFNWDSIIPISLDKADAITWNSDLISFLPGPVNTIKN